MKLNFIKPLLIGFCTAAFAFLVFGMIMERNQQTEYAVRMEEKYDKINDQINELYIHRDELNDKLRAVSIETNRQKESQATVTLILNGPDRKLVQDAEDILDSYSYCANVAVSPEKFPGNARCISIDEMKDLTADGWEMVIAPQKSEDVNETAKKIGEKGLQRAKAIYLGPDFDLDELDETIQQAGYNGIRTVFADSSLAIGEDIKASVICAEDYRSDAISNRIEEVVSDNGVLAIVVCPVKRREESFSTGLTNVLSTIDLYVESEECLVTRAEEAGIRHDKYKSIMKRISEKEDVEKAQLEAEIERVNEQIRTIHENMVK